MNVVAHQEKNEKTGKRKAGEGTRHETNFKETVRYPSVFVQGAARRKNGLCRGEFLG